MGSALGKALSMTSSTSWNDVVNKIKGVANKGNLNWSGSNTTYTVSAGYYTGGTLDSRTSYNNGYSAGRTQGQNDVKNSPNRYSLYTKSQYDSNYNNGRNQGRTDVKNSPNSYGLYTKSQYDANWSNGYNNGISNIRITSGSYTSNSRRNFTINGSSANRAYGTINPGGNPMAVIAYDPNRNDTFAIRFGSSWMCSCKFQYGVNMNECSWTSSAVDLPQTTTTAHNMKWYAAVY